MRTCLLLIFEAVLQYVTQILPVASFNNYMVTILAVVLHIFILFISDKLKYRFATIYTGWLEQTRLKHTHIPSRSFTELLGLIQLAFTLTWKLL